jgi:hypothetical protein
MHSLSKIVERALLMFAVVGLSGLIAIGAAASVFAQSVTQGYFTDVALQRGMIVGLKEDDASKVEPINASKADKIHGVVVGSGDSNIILSQPDQPILIATSGRFEVLISDQNGPIKQGDYIAVSSANGIGMRSDDAQLVVIGRALADFAGKDDPRFLSSSKLKDGNGNEVPINIGRVSVDIVIGKNPLAKNQDNVPDALKRAGEFIAGKPVPPSRIYVGFTLLLASAAIAGSVVYSAVRSGIISIGRNPLSKKSIIRGIFQMVIVAFIIFFSGIFGVYLILKL